MIEKTEKINNLKDTPTLILVHRLNELIRQSDEQEMKQMELEKEYNSIVYELWRRIPSLETDVNIQPKSRKRVKSENNIKTRD